MLCYLVMFRCWMLIPHLVFPSINATGNRHPLTYVTSSIYLLEGKTNKGPIARCEQYTPYWTPITSCHQHKLEHGYHLPLVHVVCTSHLVRNTEAGHVFVFTCPAKVLRGTICSCTLENGHKTPSQSHKRPPVIYQQT
jgi:hypothetical protein